MFKRYLFGLGSLVFYSYFLPLAADPLIKDGNGTLTLYNDNTATFFGDTFINGGTLALADQGTLSTSGLVTILDAIFDISASSVSQTIGALSGTGAVTLGTTSLSLGGSNASTTFSGSFSGSGTVTKTGTGTFTLSGNNSGASFPLIVQGGTLSVSNNNNFSTGTWTLQNTTLQTTGTSINTSHALILSGGGTLEVPSGASSIFSGAFTGTGPLTKTGSGTLTLSSASNSYSGGTVISAGTLSSGIANALPSGSDLTMSGSSQFLLNDHNQTLNALSSSSTSSGIQLGSLSSTVLTIGSGGATASFSGAISGGGVLYKTGSGTQTLLGTNTYSGGTKVEGAGELVGNTSSLQGTIQNKSTLVFLQESSGTFSGTVSALDGVAGDLTKEGAGSLVLSGAEITQTNFSIQEGEVEIDATDSISVVNLEIGADAALSGVGTINPPSSNTLTVDVYGTVSPGNPTGILSINGSYNQKSGSVFTAYFNPSPIPVTSTLSAQTVVIEDNTTIQITPEFATYPPNSSYTLLVAQDQNLTGKFTYEVNNLPLIQVTLQYSSSALVALMNIVPVIDVITKGNAGAIAHCLVAEDISQDPDIIFIKDVLNFSTMEELEQNLTEMQPSMLTSLGLTKEESMIGISSSLEERLNALQLCRCKDKQNIHLWAVGGWEKSNQNSMDGEPGFHTRVKSIVLGVDASGWKYGYLGGLIGYAYDSIHWKQDRGYGSINEYYTGLYGGARGSHWYIQGAALGSFDQYQATRLITLEASDSILVERNARHQSPGFGLSSYLEFGFPFGKKLCVRPFGRFDYVFLEQNGFKETGAQSLDLHVHQHRANLLRMEGALSFSSCFKNKKICWTPHIDVGVVTEKRYQGAHLLANIQNSSCVFEVKGLNPNRFLFAPAAGILIKTCYDRLQISCDYFSEWGKEFHKYTWYGKLEFDF